MPRPLTKAQAWRMIARRIAEGRWQEEGLCAEIYRLYAQGYIGYVEKHEMYEAIDGHLMDTPDDAKINSAWFDELGVVDTRVLAALFLSLEAANASA